MATQLRRTHRLSKPRLKFVLGRWEVFYGYISNMALVDEAEKWCSEMNGGTRALTRAMTKLAAHPTE
ncbi:hypothetical protein [Pseudomonas poae]|uniref:Uncharacterized protein n=1 Tax=Pseudomonas poae TaxID=200451 RepID=A0AAP2WH40_9PSED|nr:hypothetical protein [Pseudomonas poae]MCF5656975.1 hypothetical protein [Pseudomonas poae]